MRVAFAACMVLLLTATALADRARALEVGGFLGGASTNVYNTGPCPIFFGSPSAPADECVSNPH